MVVYAFGYNSVLLCLSLISGSFLQFSNFFSWLLKSVKILMSEPSDQLLPFSRFGICKSFIKLFCDCKLLKLLMFIYFLVFAVNLLLYS